MLTFFIKQVPLRQTVATAGVGEAFAVPGATSSLAEIESKLSTLTRREAGRTMIERLAKRAGLELGAAQCLLLGQLGRDPDVDLAALAARRKIEPARVIAVADQLASLGLAGSAGDPGGRALTPAGRDALDLLMSTARARLHELLEGWEPGAHPELGALVTRVAGALMIDTSQLERLMTPAAAGAPAGGVR